MEVESVFVTVADNGYVVNITMSQQGMDKNDRPFDNSETERHIAKTPAAALRIIKAALNFKEEPNADHA